jgi:hypothetical protein
MGSLTSRENQLTSLDLEMIKISWSFVKDKQDLGLNTMIRYILMKKKNSLLSAQYLYLNCRIFESSNEIKQLFMTAGSLVLVSDSIEITLLNYHANQIIKTFDKIVILFTESLITQKDKEKLVELGKRHYHYGLKKEHFIIFENCFIKSLEESLQVHMFKEKFENPWRKLIRYIFKKYTNGMNFQKKEELKYKNNL